MKKDFEFDMVGKRLPYTVPDGFFDQMERNVMAKVGRVRKRRIFMTIYAPVAVTVATAAAVLLGVVFHTPSYNNLQLATASTENLLLGMTDEEVSEMNNTLSADYFLADNATY